MTGISLNVSRIKEVVVIGRTDVGGTEPSNRPYILTLDSWPRAMGRKVSSSTPGGSRTPNPRLRRPMLYPVELQALVLRLGGTTGIEPAASGTTTQRSDHWATLLIFCTPERTRTSNPRLRRPMLCPVELRAHIGLLSLANLDEQWKITQLFLLRNKLNQFLVFPHLKMKIIKCKSYAFPEHSVVRSADTGAVNTHFSFCIEL